jgi:subfamily B ATP-binding cassette protein MsbA
LHENYNAVVNRVKMMSKLDIAEKRKPQDGGSTFKNDKKEVDLRVSILPTKNNERIVMRILNKDAGDKALSELGFESKDLERLIKAITNPQGMVLVTGPTGSGKTTIIQLLAKFYSPTAGSITIDGVDIAEFEVDSLRSQIAFVDQNVRLFNDTVKGNIALGQIDTMSDAQIQHAAKTSNAFEFIQELSCQFDTEIGEDGTKLSGGQRQRLAIARAIAKDSPILILDEATSALDTESEKLVQKALENMMKNRTSIVIAHRLSTIQNADNIIVMQRGEIVEQGKHNELLTLNGTYKNLVEMQSFE